MIRSLLIANRGEIARRIIRTCRRLGIRAVAAYSDADATSLAVAEAGVAVRLGPAPAADSYLNIPAIIEAARLTGVDAVHPGFGFLAESAAFARACRDAGLAFIGPTAEAIAAMGDKRAARELAERSGVPVIPGYNGGDQRDDAFAHEAGRIGYPIMVKAAGGGGGKGLRLVHDPASLPEALAGARREAIAAFGSGDLLLERALTRPRHIEVQILGDQRGRVIHLGERECSIQRRHQKVIEESPSPIMTPELREEMGGAAVGLAGDIGYTGAGTVEFLWEDGRYYFLEMNTRLQVEHPVTEMVTGIDLVEWQIRIAEGQALPWTQADIRPRGHAIEARLYAEDPARDYQPATGPVLLWRPPVGDGIRVDGGLQAGDEITSHYDPLLAKIIAHGDTRTEAISRLRHALRGTTLLGLATNLQLLTGILEQPEFEAGDTTTRFLEEHPIAARPAAEDGLNDTSDDATLALAAVALARYRADAAGGPGYWRNNPGRPAPYRLRIDGRDVAVSLVPKARAAGEFRIEVPPLGPLDVTLDTFIPPDMTLTMAGRRGQMALATRGHTWWVRTDSGAIRVEALPLLPEPRPAADAGGSLRAPMPGRVLAVLVEVGQPVSEGQPLVKLEAMKMEHTIRTAAAGVVEAVYFAPGDQVGADELLVRIGAG